MSEGNPKPPTPGEATCEAFFKAQRSDLPIREVWEIAGRAAIATQDAPELAKLRKKLGIALDALLEIAAMGDDAAAIAPGRAEAYLADIADVDQ
jgi:hypothetical protein